MVGRNQGFAYTGPTFDEKDGIVVLYNAFGLVGELKPDRDMNRTITHEMGHHLSLYHTFFNTTSCSSETNCEAQGDEVCDTPPTRANNQGCGQAVCTGAQVENYMDYTPQECKNAFTAGPNNTNACMPGIRAPESVGEPRLDSCCGHGFDIEWREQLGQHDLLVNSGALGGGDQFGH